MSVFNFFELKSQPAWDQYVQTHENGSIFHLSAMFRAFEDSPGYTPFNIAASNSEGKIVAMIAAVKVESPCEISSEKSTSRSMMYAEPLCDNSHEGAAAVIQLLDLYDGVWNQDILFSEIQSLNTSDTQSMIYLDQEYQRLTDRNLVIDFAQEVNWAHPRFKKLIQGKDFAEANRVVIERVSPTEHANRISEFIQDQCLGLNAANAQVESLLAMIQHLPTDSLQLRVASIDGSDVAISLGFLFKNRFYGWFNAQSKDLSFDIQSSLTLNEIEEALRCDLARCDFFHSDLGASRFESQEFDSLLQDQDLTRSRFIKIGAKLKLVMKQRGKVNFSVGELLIPSTGESRQSQGAPRD